MPPLPPPKIRLRRQTRACPSYYVWRRRQCLARPFESTDSTFLFSWRVTRAPLVSVVQLWMIKWLAAVPPLPAVAAFGPYQIRWRHPKEQLTPSTIRKRSLQAQNVCCLQPCSIHGEIYAPIPQPDLARKHARCAPRICHDHNLDGNGQTV